MDIQKFDTRTNVIDFQSQLVFTKFIFWLRFSSKKLILWLERSKSLSKKAAFSKAVSGFFLLSGYCRKDKYNDFQYEIQPFRFKVNRYYPDERNIAWNCVGKKRWPSKLRKTENFYFVFSTLKNGVQAKNHQTSSLLVHQNLKNFKFSTWWKNISQ